MRKVFSDHNSQKGQSLIEMAISMVVLLILIAGIFDLSRTIFTYLSMRDAAQEGAAYASIEPTSCDEIVTRTSDNLEDFTTIEVRMNGKPCTTASAVTDSCAGHEARVTVQLNFPMTMPFIGAFIGTEKIDLRATATDTIIRPYCK
ncbi:MAG: TadE family protein [Anaerolineaceae bacterium]